MRISINSFKPFYLIAILLLTLGSISSILAEESVVAPGVKGIWMAPGETEESGFAWKAHWIWMDEASDDDVLLARKTFAIRENPKSVKLRITASSIYQLFINGEHICRGPARSAPHHQSYDILDITDLVNNGNNTIAIRVHRQKGTFSYQHDGRAGLLAQLNINKKEESEVIRTDSSWKVTADPSWDNMAPAISRFQQVVVDKIDLRKKISGWNKPDFDDSYWSNATPLMRNVGWPSPQQNAIPQALTPPWTALVPRDVPYLVESEIEARNLIQAIALDEENKIVFRDGWQEEPIKIDRHVERSFKKAFENLVDGKPTIFEVGNETPIFLLVDLGGVINGFPMLKIEGEAGTTVDILYAPFMVDDHFTSNIVDSNLHDQIILSGQLDDWEPVYFKPARYLGLLVHGENNDVKIHYLGMRKMSYPFKGQGQIYSNDAPWVKEYVEASAKTIDVCTTDGYTDNYRERRQYAQTGYYAALGNYFTFGDMHLQRRYLLQTAQEQKPNGIMPAYAPAASDDFMVIMDSNCLWIRSLRNYLLYSGDFLTVRELLPSAKKLMGLLHEYTNKEGMIDNPPFAYWMDHAINDRRGANFTLNGHYLGALEDFAELLGWLNDDKSGLFQERAKRLRASLQRQLWDQDKQLFADALVDGVRSNMFSEHANAMALAMEVANEEQVKAISAHLLLQDEHNFIKRASGITMVTPAMSYFLHKGLCEAGYIDESLNMFRSRFDKMLVPETNGTLWEEWWLDAIGRSGKLQKGRTRSDAQTESAFPPALFAEYLLGFEAVRPGLSEVVLKKQRHKLKHVKGVIPGPLGELSIEWDMKDSGNVLRVDIPENMKIKIDLKSLKLNPSDQLVLDNRALSDDIKRNQYLEIKPGEHVLSF